MKDSPQQKGSAQMGTTKKARKGGNAVHVRATVGEVEKVVTSISDATVKAITRGTGLILKGGQSVAHGVYVVAMATVKITEVKGGKLLQGASLEAARGAIRGIVGDAVAASPVTNGNAAAMVHDAVKEAVVEMAALIYRVNRHRHQCIDNVHVPDGVSLAATRFLAILKSGHPVDVVIRRQITASLGGVQKFDTSIDGVEPSIIASQESFLSGICNAVEDGTYVLTGREGRKFVSDLRGTFGLTGDHAAGGKGTGAGQGGKKNLMPVKAALAAAGETFSNVTLKDQGGTDASTAQAALSAMRQIAKMIRPIGPCAGLKSIAAECRKLADDLEARVA